MSWLDCEIKKEAETGMPDGYDMLPSLGTRDEAPIPVRSPSRPTDKEIDALLAEVKPEPSAMTVDALIGRPADPPAKRLFVWERTGESIDETLAQVHQQTPAARPATRPAPVERPPEPAPPEVDGLRSRQASRSLSHSMTELRGRYSPRPARQSRTTAPRLPPRNQSAGVSKSVKGSCR